MPGVHTRNGGGAGGAFDPSVLEPLQSQIDAQATEIDNAKTIAQSDTLQAGETIAEAGEIHRYGGHAWESLTDNAVVPDPLTVAALIASPDFGEPNSPTSHPFGDSQVSVRALDLFADREVIQQTGGDFGIYTNRFHLSDDPAVVGNLQGKTITFQRGVPKDLYLIGPTVRGPGETIDSCLLYTSPSPRDRQKSRMPSSA